jgi:hypothetical protein
MNQVLRGRVQAGKGDASRWLSLFNAAYSRKLGHPIYPGSLNLALDHDFRWFDPAYKAHLICFGRGARRQPDICSALRAGGPRQKEGVALDPDHSRPRTRGPLGH